jgi:hypothetical protein
VRCKPGVYTGRRDANRSVVHDCAPAKRRIPSAPMKVEAVMARCP